VRSSMETSASLACVFGAHWLSKGDLLASAAIGAVSSVACIGIIMAVENLTAAALAKLHRPGTPRGAAKHRNTSLIAELRKWDTSVSKAVFDTCRSGSCRTLATVCSLLVDDGTCLLLLIGSWFFVLYLQWAGHLTVATDEHTLNDNHCTVEAIVQSYLLFMSWSAVETSLKLIVRVPRPSYRKQKPLSDVIIPGDQFSWPSGHSIRAFAAARAPFASPSLHRLGWSLAAAPAAPVLEVLLLVVALFAGWSRVALGKHSLLDVISGATIGLLWFPFFEALGSDSTRLAFELLCGGYYLVVGVTAISSLSVRQFYGLVHEDQLCRFLATAVWGSWMYCLARLDNSQALGHHNFAHCGMGGLSPDFVGNDSDLWAPALAAAVLAFCLLSAALVAKSMLWRLLVIPAAAFILLATELSSTTDTGLLDFLRPTSALTA